MKADSSVFRKDSRSLLSSDHEGSEERLELGCNLISEDHPNGREKSPEDSLSTEMSGPEAFNKKTQTDLKIGSELKRVASVESEKMSFLRKIVITISSCEKVSKKMQSCLTREIMKAERESFTQILSQKWRCLKNSLVFGQTIRLVLKYFKSKMPLERSSEKPCGYKCMPETKFCPSREIISESRKFFSGSETWEKSGINWGTSCFTPSIVSFLLVETPEKTSSKGLTPLRPNGLLSNTGFAPCFSSVKRSTASFPPLFNCINVGWGVTCQILVWGGTTEFLWWCEVSTVIFRRDALLGGGWFIGRFLVPSVSWGWRSGRLGKEAGIELGNVRWLVRKWGV